MFKCIADTLYSDLGVTRCNPSLRAGTRILTSDGVFPIEKLENRFFKTRNFKGEWIYSRCWKSGTDKPLYKLTMANGKEFYCTADHKWPILHTEDSSNVTNIEEITEEMDNVSIDNVKNIEENIQQAYNVNTATEISTGAHKNITRKLTTDIKTNDRLPYIKSHTLCHPKDGVGSYTDGFCIALLYCSPTNFIIDCDTHRQYVWVFPEISGKNDFVPILITWMNSIDYASIKAFKQKDDKGTEFIVIIQQSKSFSEHMNKFGVTSEKQIADKTYGVPQAVWTGSEDFRHGFIDGLYSYVGGIDNKQGLVYISSVSETFVRDLWDLFGFYGIKSVIKIDQKSDDGNSITPIVVIEGYMFSQVFRVTDHKKQEGLDKLEFNEQEQTGEIEITSCELTELKEDVWDVAVYDTSHMFSLSHCFTGNCGE